MNRKPSHIHQRRGSLWLIHPHLLTHVVHISREQGLWITTVEVGRLTPSHKCSKHARRVLEQPEHQRQRVEHPCRTIRPTARAQFPRSYLCLAEIVGRISGDHVVLAEPAPPGRTTTNSRRSPGTSITPMRKFIRWAKKHPTSGVSTTCWATCGNGAGIDWIPTSTGTITSFVGVVGPITRGAAERRAGVEAIHPFASTTSGFASSGPESKTSRLGSKPQRKGGANHARVSCNIVNRGNEAARFGQAPRRCIVVFAFAPF